MKVDEEAVTCLSTLMREIEVDRMKGVVAVLMICSLHMGGLCIACGNC